MFDSDALPTRASASVHVPYAVDYRALWRYCWVWGPPARTRRFSCQYTINENGPDASPDVDACAVVKESSQHTGVTPIAPKSEVNEDELT